MKIAMFGQKRMPSREGGVGSRLDTGEVFQRQHCLGVWAEWQELY